MNFRKTAAIILSILLVVLSLTGCADNSEKNGGNDEMKTIAVIAKGESHAFWQSVKQGAEDAAKKYGGYNITFRGTTAETAS